MSFRLFIYYCALCGGWAALLGWFLGRMLAQDNPVGGAGIKAMCLGMLVGLALALVDTLWNYALHQVVQVVPRVLAGVGGGAVGGLIGGVVGQALYGWKPLPVFFIFGWTVTGLLVGVSLGAFDVLDSFVRQEDVRKPGRKVLKGVLGGTLGGLLGGLSSLLFRWAWEVVFHTPASDELWSPTALGFVALGTSIGLMIGLAQVLLRETWIRVEAGFRSGRELILTKPEITIGRAESCDIGLFGDTAIERLHARLLLQGDRYMLADADSGAGTYVNDQRITQPMPLRSGDAIRVGKTVLRFEERRKRQ